jgi:uncharacterized protein (TIGR03000 family)
LALALTLTATATGQNSKTQDKGGEKKPVNLKVLVAQDNATLTIEGAPTKAAGPTRTFVSPPLEPGKKYRYTLVSVHQPNNYTTITRTVVVSVEAGQTIDVDLSKTMNDERVLVRYVPTPHDIVEQMLKLGKVGKDDVVYDLGCGDGRMVIAAVKKGGAKKGIGIDIDPVRVKESIENVKSEGVADKVEIRQGDVLDVKDISDATVILLYMGDDLNNRLKPILRKSLKPGARIVSHRFTMGDWKPETTETVTGQDGDTYKLHLWRIEK